MKKKIRNEMIERVSFFDSLSSNRHIHSLKSMRTAFLKDLIIFGAAV